VHEQRRSHIAILKLDFHQHSYLHTTNFKTLIRPNGMHTIFPHLLHSKHIQPWRLPTEHKSI
jgi:hypothetical protein